MSKDVSPAPHGERLLTVAEVAKFLRVTPKTVYLMARANKIPAVKVGKLLRFSQAQINDWLKTQQPETKET